MAPTARVLSTSVLLLAFGPAGLSQSKQEVAFHRAYYLEHSEHDFDQALSIYQKVASDNGASEELRKKAHWAAAGITEDLAAANFTQLMPTGTMLYLEMNQPAGQLEQLLEQLGLLASYESLAAGEFGISPRLLDSALGLKGAAVGITQVNPMTGQPGGVAILHPGRQDLVRGLIETMLPAGGQQVDSIGGYPTWSIEKQAYVTMTSRLVIASQSKREIEGVVARLQGEGKESLADVESLQHALKHSGQGLISFCVNPAPLKPLMQLALSSVGSDPRAGMAIAALDPHSLQAVAGHIGVDDEGLVLNLGLELEEGHRNLAFNFTRRQSFDHRTLELVPSGAAFFLATAFNPTAGVAQIEQDAAEQPMVSAMDFGRELFGNLCDLAVFGMPGSDSPMPHVAAVMRVNDPERSRAVWSLVLGLASQATQGNMEPQRSEIAGAAVDTYTIQGMPIHLAAGSGELVLSPSAAAIEHSLAGREHGTSVLNDDAFASGLARLPESSIFAAVVNVGRCAEMAAIHVPESERAELAQIAQMVGSTVIGIGVEHSQTRLSVAARVSRVPDMSDLVAQALQQWKGQANAARASVVRAIEPVEEHSYAQPKASGTKSAKLASDSKSAKLASGSKSAKKVAAYEDIEATFEALASKRPHDHAAAVVAGKALIASISDDPMELNNLAWRLLTEDRYDGDFAELALEASRRSNAMTDAENWMYVDTLALAYFENGNVEKAIATEKKAVQLAEGDSRQSEAQAALARFVAAKNAAANGDE